MLHLGTSRPRRSLAERFRRGARSLAAGLVVFVVLSLSLHAVISAQREGLKQEYRAQVGQHAATVMARLESDLTAQVFLANGLVAHIVAMRGKLDGTVMDALGALYKHGRHIRNIGVAPGNRVSHVYPRQGNEAALGLYYPDIPSQWPAVQRAIAARTSVLAGPVPLAQGGIGLISRTPVFFDDGTYWGIISLVIDAEGLFHDTGLRPETDGIRFALRGRDGRGPVGEVFFGEPALFESDSIRMTLNTPGGSWQLAAYPTGGWDANQHHLDGIQFLGMVASAVLALAVFAYHRGQTRVANSERRLRTFLETTRDGVIVIDEKGLVEAFNPAATTLFGYKPEEVLGQSLNRLMPDADAAHHDAHVRHSRDGQSHLMARGRQVRGRHKDGHEFPIEVTVGRALDDDRPIFVGVVRDITERKAFEAKLMELASTDGLTGALNRRAFMEKAEDLVRLSRRHGHPLAVLMIDADNFKKINDTLGHHTGDAVLVRLAEIARESLRTTDVFGRLGGEEFAAILPQTGAQAAAEVAERLLAAIRAAEVDAGNGHTQRFSVSIGGAQCCEAAQDTLEALLQRADVALYRAKSEGRDRYCS